MKTNNLPLRSMLAALGLTLATVTASGELRETTTPSPQKDPQQAGSERDAQKGRHDLAAVSHAQQFKATELIGKEVKNDLNENLGKIDDLILMPDSGAAPYAILASGGAFGIGETRIAVSVSSLKFSPEGPITLSATKEELASASKTPTGEWASASGQEWAKNIHGYFSSPGHKGAQFERESLQPSAADRERVRTETEAAGPTARGVGQRMRNEPPVDIGRSTTSPAIADRAGDEHLKQRITQSLQQTYSQAMATGLRVQVNDGAVTLHGSVQSEQEKQSIETRVKAMPGVQRVDNQLTVQNR